MYTHLACGFTENGKLNKRFKVLLERISKMNGWFVPVATLLDYVLTVRGNHEITRGERQSLEARWLKYKLLETRGRT
jgi:hypothetical protein